MTSNRSLEEENALLRSQLKDLAHKALKKRVEVDGLPSTLKEDRSFWLDAIKMRSIRLQDLPAHLQTDRELALTAIEHDDFLFWSQLPKNWKNDAEVAILYLKRNQMDTSEVHQIGIGFLLSAFNGVRVQNTVPKWQDLPEHLKANRNVVEQAMMTHCGPNWDQIPSQLQNDKNLMVTALLYRKIDWEKIPRNLCKRSPEVALWGVQRGKTTANACPCLTPDFLRDALEQRKLRWRMLPDKLRNDIQFAKSITITENPILPGELLENFPELRQDADFWHQLWHFYTNQNEEREFTLAPLLEDYKPRTILGNPGKMAKICQKESAYNLIAEEEFSTDRTFLESVLKYNPSNIVDMPEHALAENMDLVIEAVYTFGRTLPYDDDDDEWAGHGTAWRISEAVPADFWSNRDFLIAWAKAGFEVPRPFVENNEVLASDEEVCFEFLVKGKIYSDTWTERQANVDFMRKVIEREPRLYTHFTLGETKKDHVIMTLAFSQLPGLAYETFTLLQREGKDNEIHEYIRHLRDQLESFDTFSQCILGNMLSTQSVQLTGTNLTLLNQGLETSRTYKNLMAEYLGVPTGKELLRLQVAEREARSALEKINAPQPRMSHYHPW